MPRYKFTIAQTRWIKTSTDPLAKNIRILIGMYNAQVDHVYLGQLDAAVGELQARWSEIMKELSVRTKTEHQQRVEQLMDGAEQHVPDRPMVPDEKTRLLRARLILEEVIETIEALGCQMVVNQEDWITPKDDMVLVEVIGPGDLEGIADGCADVIVVTTGTLSACGIADDSLQTEVDNNNLKKFRHICPKCGSDWTDVLAGSHEALCMVQPMTTTRHEPGMWKCGTCGTEWRSGYSDEHGKWIKPSTHKPPNIGEVIKEQTGLVEARGVERAL